MEWWNSMAVFDQVIWVIAVFSGILFLYQSIHTFLRMEIEVISIDKDEEDTGSSNGFLELLTVSNCNNFLTGFSWTLIIYKDVFDNRTILFFFGILSGISLVAIVLWFFYLLSKTIQGEDFIPENCIDSVCDVYLPIPECHSGVGKIQINIEGNIREIEAVTTGERLSTGEKVRVVDIIDDQILLVERMK